MLTAEAVIGKVVVFIVQKAASKLMELSFDKRRKACRSLTKLYYALQALDDVTENIFKTVADFRSTKSGEAYAVMNSLNNHMHEVALASNMFIDLGYELRAGLEIIDPALADCCDALYVTKFDFLNEMSDTVEWDRSTTPSHIVVKMPRRTTDENSLESGYTQALDAYRRGEKHYWPDTWKQNDIPNKVILTWEDNAGAENFLKRISEHRTILIEAKNSLRDLLKSSFNVEELLFQTDTHPCR